MAEKAEYFGKTFHLGLVRHGSVSRTALLHAGLSRHQIAQALKTGRLIRVHAGVYAVGRPLTTPVEHAAAAVLACGPHAALGGRSTLALDDLCPWPRIPFVLVARKVQRPGIEIRCTTTLHQCDVHLRRGIPTTTTERALLDSAPDTDPPALRRLVNTALRRRRTSRTKLRALLSRHPRHPGAGRLAGLVAQAQPTRSPFEDDFLTFCARHSLPTPRTCSAPFGYEVDAYFPDERVIVELDSEEFHLDAETFRADHERDLHHTTLGILTIRLIWEHVARRPAQSAERLHRILEQRRRPQVA
jgi:hypothetical protein